MIIFSCRLAEQRWHCSICCFSTAARKRRAPRSAFPPLEQPLLPIQQHVFEANLRNSNACWKKYAFSWTHQSDYSMPGTNRLFSEGMWSWVRRWRKVAGRTPSSGTRRETKSCWWGIGCVCCWMMRTSWSCRRSPVWTCPTETFLLLAASLVSHLAYLALIMFD